MGVTILDEQKSFFGIVIGENPLSLFGKSWTLSTDYQGSIIDKSTENLEVTINFCILFMHVTQTLQLTATAP